MAIRHVAIIGGGTAGWLSALMLRRYLDTQQGATTGTQLPLEITVVESSAVPSIGVGEGTTAVFRSVLKDLGIDERDFLHRTGATIKYGIKHKDWRHINHVYDGPIDDPHLVTDLAGDIPWLDVSAVSSGQSVSQHHLFHYLLNLEKGPVAKVGAAQEVAVGPYHYAYHFDQEKVGRYLRDMAIDVNTIDAKIVSVECNDNGDIDAAVTEDGQRIQADFYIDCTGFKRALIGQLSSYRWESFNDTLPVNRAMPFWLPLAKDKPLPPYTLAWAQQSGWLWNIPTQERMGCGYVYCDQFTSPDEAQAEIEGALGHPIEPRNDIRFDSGRLKESWVNNCLAVGLSSSFLEPLEATSIHATVVQLLLLINGHCKKNESGYVFSDSDSYNTTVANQVDDFRDFINLHYVSERRDSAFWQHIAADCISLINLDRIERWKTTMPRKSSFRSMPYGLPHIEDQLYYPVIDGLGLLDKTAAKSLLAKHPTKRTHARKTIAELKKEFRVAAAKAVSHRGYLRSY